VFLWETLAKMTQVSDVAPGPLVFIQTNHHDNFKRTSNPRLNRIEEPFAIKSSERGRPTCVDYRRSPTNFFYHDELYLFIFVYPSVL
jgi:hypothetical protein